MANEPVAVWVVDDDRSVRFVLATALRDAGYDVTGFDSAQAVHDALARGAPPRLLFTDHHDDLPLIQACSETLWFGPPARMGAVRSQAPGVRISDGLQPGAKLLVHREALC